MNFLNKLSGYRTYITAIGIIMAGVNMISAGDWSEGVLHIIQSKEIIPILMGLGLGALRASVEKILIALKGSNVFVNDAVPSMEDYLFVDYEGKPVSKAVYNKTMKDLDMIPVMSMSTKK